MKSVALFLAAFGLLATLHAQRVTLKSGEVIPAEAVARSGATLNVTIKLPAGKVTRGIPAASVQKIDFPEPPDLAAASQILESGNAALALAKINPVIAAQQPFRDIPGNWWDKAVNVKLSALGVLRLDEQIAPLVAELARFSGSPETARIARLYEAKAQLKKGNNEGAVAVANILIEESKQSDLLASAWLIAGQAELARKNYRAALLAFLHVPVFFPDQKVAMPTALLGSARAFEGMEDFARAKDALDKLVADYPGSPEATESKEDLKRVTRQLNKI